jgi:hypothetical protein
MTPDNELNKSIEQQQPQIEPNSSRRSELLWTPNGISLEKRQLSPTAIEKVEAFFARFGQKDEGSK